jgi:hypothetical protein
MNLSTTKKLTHNIITILPNKIFSLRFFKPYTKPQLGRWNIDYGKKFMKLQEGRNYPY